MPALSEHLARFIADFSLEDSPARAALVDKAKLHFLDAIGLAFAGVAAEDRFGDELIRTAQQFGRSDEATVIGHPARLAAPLAALVNGSLVHGNDFDDIHYERTMHVESFSVASTLATAERDRRSGASLLEAWVLASEVALRLAAGCRHEEDLYASGFHTTAMFGCFGSAAGAAKLLGLNQGSAAAALALCPSLAAGTAAGWTAGSGRNKALQPGWAALAGTTAALLAHEGYDCALDTIEGPTGFYASHARAEGWQVEPVLAGLGEEWKTLEIAFKLHPAGAMLQAALDCAGDVRALHAVDPAEITAITVVVPKQYANILRELDPTSLDAESGYTAFASWPINVARIMLDGVIGIEERLSARPPSPEVMALARRVTCVADTDDSRPVHERETAVSVETARGRFEARRSRHRGHPESVGRPEITAKFRSNAALVISRDQAAEIEDSVWRLEDLSDARSLATRLSRAATTAESAAGSR